VASTDGLPLGWEYLEAGVHVRQEERRLERAVLVDRFWLSELKGLNQSDGGDRVRLKLARL
jgi:hypothetical protein